MSTLVTHFQPHLDDLCGMWLLDRYMPGFEGADIDFIASNTPHEEAVDTGERLHIGVGRGEFDEHKGDIGDCATSLVYAYLLNNDLVPENDRPVLKRMVDWVFLEDTGMLMTEPYREFSIPHMLLGDFYASGKDSTSVAIFCAQMLEALFESLSNEVKLDAAWETRVEIETRYGPCAVLVTDAHEIAPYVYAKGFNLAATVDPEGTYHNIRGKAGTDIDLTLVQERLAEIDGDADWFFHHSKKMLICGGEKQPDATPSSLTPEQLIKLLETV